MTVLANDGSIATASTSPCPGWGTVRCKSVRSTTNTAGQSTHADQSGHGSGARHMVTIHQHYISVTREHCCEAVILCSGV